jgi:hypothetical protein
MDKEPVFALVERRGRVRSHHVPAVDADTLRPILQARAAKLAKGIVGKRLTYRRPHGEATEPQAH